NPGGDVLLLRQRWRGFQTMIETAGGRAELVGVDPDLANDQERAAQQVVERWFALSPRPAGLFLPSDRLTEAVCLPMNSPALVTGEEVEFVSVDNDSSYLALTKPPPASIDLNRETIACLAAERLMWRMRQPSEVPQALICVRPTLPGFDI